MFIYMINFEVNNNRHEIKSVSSNNCFQSFPTGILCKIFSQLDNQSLTRIFQVNKKFNKLKNNKLIFEQMIYNCLSEISYNVDFNKIKTEINISEINRVKFIQIFKKQFPEKIKMILEKVDENDEPISRSQQELTRNDIINKIQPYSELNVIKEFELLKAWIMQSRDQEVAAFIFQIFGKLTLNQFDVIEYEDLKNFIEAKVHKLTEEKNPSFFSELVKIIPRATIEMNVSIINRLLADLSKNISF